MGQLVLTMKYRKNTGMIFNPTEIFSLYLYGITIQGGDGTSFSSESMRFYIQAAQREVENFFNLKLMRQFIDQEKLTEPTIGRVSLFCSRTIPSTNRYR